MASMHPKALSMHAPIGQSSMTRALLMLAPMFCWGPSPPSWAPHECNSTNSFHDDSCPGSC